MTVRRHQGCSCTRALVENAEMLSRYRNHPALCGPHLHRIRTQTLKRQGKDTQGPMKARNRRKHRTSLPGQGVSPFPCDASHTKPCSASPNARNLISEYRSEKRLYAVFRTATACLRIAEDVVLSGGSQAPAASPRDIKRRQPSACANGEDSSANDLGWIRGVAARHEGRVLAPETGCENPSHGCRRSL